MLTIVDIMLCVIISMHTCSHFQIMATDADFWNSDAKELKLMHEERIYPPRFQIHAYATQCVCTPIVFQGTAENIKIELLLKPAISGIMIKLQKTCLPDTIHP